MYEADAIKEWSDSGHKATLVTKLELENFVLVPDNALRHAHSGVAAKCLNTLLLIRSGIARAVIITFLTKVCLFFMRVNEKLKGISSCGSPVCSQSGLSETIAQTNKK